MTILYRSNGIVPPGVNGFPPSIMNTEWYENIQASIGGAWLTFQTKAEMDAWIEANKLPAEFLPDLIAWKNAHGIVFTEEYFEVDMTDIYSVGLFKGA